MLSYELLARRILSAAFGSILSLHGLADALSIPFPNKAHWTAPLLITGIPTASIRIQILRSLAGASVQKARLSPQSSNLRRASPLHVKWRNQEGPRATSRLRPDGLGRRGPGELRGTAVLPQTSLGQSSTAPWTDRPPPGKKRETD
jgi:hypothetical protein